MAHVQTVNVFTTAASAGMGPITVTVGDLLLVMVKWGTTTGPFTVSDNLGNTYSGPIYNYSQAGDTGTTILIWYAINIIGGSCTTTVGAGVSAGIRGMLAEFSVLGQIAPLDLNVAHKDSTSSITTITSNAGTPTESAEMLISYLALNINEASFTAGTLGSGTGTIPTNGTVGSRCAYMFHHETKSASDTGTFSWPTASVSSSIVLFSFKDIFNNHDVPFIPEQIRNTIIPIS